MSDYHSSTLSTTFSARLSSFYCECIVYKQSICILPWLFAWLHTKLAKVAVTKDSGCSPLRVFFSHDPGEGARDVWNATEDQRVPGINAVPSTAHNWDLQAAAAATAPALAPEAVSTTACRDLCSEDGGDGGERRETQKSSAQFFCRDMVLNWGQSTCRVLHWQHPFWQHSFLFTSW